MIIGRRTLTHLGFEKHLETPESSGSDTDWYYYTLNIGSLCLITQSSDDAVNGWEVMVFDDESVKITDPNELQILIGVLTRNKVK